MTNATLATGDTSTPYTPEMHRIRDAMANTDWMDIHCITPETIEAGYRYFDEQMAEHDAKVRADAVKEYRNGRLVALYRCCEHCTDDPEYHAEGAKDDHTTDCGIGVCGDGHMFRLIEKGAE